MDLVEQEKMDRELYFDNPMEGEMRATNNNFRIRSNGNSVNVNNNNNNNNNNNGKFYSPNVESRKQGGK
mgnify:CR=1 FL=1|jgi:hypothetical protein